VAAVATLYEQFVSLDEPLSSAQVAECNRQGFLVIDKPLISEPEIRWCRDILMQMIERGTGQKEGRAFDVAAREGARDGISLSLFRPSLYATELSRWPFREIGLAMAKQLLGPDATLAGDNTVFKPRRLGGATAWHQDEAYNNPLRYQRQVTIWIAMFDTTLENGAMAFIPGSQLLGVLPHRLQGGARYANAIECCRGFDPKDAKVCPIPAGGMTIHLGCTIHGASANTSDGNRLGYILNYKTPAQSHPELGEFSWNANVAASVHAQRRRWLLRGGIFQEIIRFVKSDRDNQRHFFNRLRKRIGL
jgi:hypothetical protein